MLETIAITLAVCGAGVDGRVVPESTEFVGLAVRGCMQCQTRSGSGPHKRPTFHTSIKRCRDS
jgi:hypothetical protein